MGGTQPTGGHAVGPRRLRVLLGAIKPLALLVDGVSGLTTTRLSSDWIEEVVVEAILGMTSPKRRHCIAPGAKKTTSPAVRRMPLARLLMVPAALTMGFRADCLATANQPLRNPLADRRSGCR